MSATGIFTLDADAYHADPCPEPSLSASIARILIDASPAHARAAHPKLNPQAVNKEAANLDLGTIAHSFILEGDLSRVDIIDADDYRTTAAKDARDLSRSLGRQPVLAKNMPAVREMFTAITEQLDAHEADPPVFTEGRPEQTLIWNEDGVWCRARLDWLRFDHGYIDDLKSTGKSADPIAVSRTIFNMGYDVQAAMYARGLRAITGKTATFRFVFVETEPPHGLSIVELSPAVMALADEKVSKAIRVWGECLRTDTWPGYTTRVATVELPAWAEARWYDREEMAA